MTIGILFASTVMVALFGRSPANLQNLSIICRRRLLHQRRHRRPYAIIAQVFPTHVRAFWTNTIGVGRGGSVLAPIIAGFLFAAGYSLPTVALILATGSTLAAIVLFRLKLEPDQPATR